MPRSARNDRQRRPSVSSDPRLNPIDPVPELLLDQLLQPMERRVPALRDLLQVVPCLLQPIGVELPDALAPAADVADETRAGENVQMFGDGLTRDVGSGR